MVIILNYNYIMINKIINKYKNFNYVKFNATVLYAILYLYIAIENYTYNVMIV